MANFAVRGASSTRAEDIRALGIRPSAARASDARTLDTPFSGTPAVGAGAPRTQAATACDSATPTTDAYTVPCAG